MRASGISKASPRAGRGGGRFCLATDWHYAGQHGAAMRIGGLTSPAGPLGVMPTSASPRQPRGQCAFPPRSQDGASASWRSLASAWQEPSAHQCSVSCIECIDASVQLTDGSRSRRGDRRVRAPRPMRPAGSWTGYTATKLLSSRQGPALVVESSGAVSQAAPHRPYPGGRACGRACRRACELRRQDLQCEARKAA